MPRSKELLEAFKKLIMMEKATKSSQNNLEYRSPPCDILLIKWKNFCMTANSAVTSAVLHDNFE